VVDVSLTRMQVVLSAGPNELDLTVRDSGIGFDPDEAWKRPGLGLTILRERVKWSMGNSGSNLNVSEAQHSAPACLSIPESIPKTPPKNEWVR